MNTSISVVLTRRNVLVTLLRSRAEYPNKDGVCDAVQRAVRLLSSGEEPLVSVLLPVHNAEAFVARAIESILDQGYPRKELLIVDDGSTDDTPIVLQRYHGHPGVRIFRAPHQGLSKSLNLAARLAAGDLLARQDADDWSSPTRLERQVERYLTGENVAMVTTDTTVVDAEGRVIAALRAPLSNEEAVRHFLRLSNPFVHGTLLFERTRFDEAGGYDEELGISQDFELIVKLLAKGSVAGVPERLYTLRVTREAASTRRRSEQLAAPLQICASIEMACKRKVPVRVRFGRWLRARIAARTLDGVPDEVLYRFRLGSLASSTGAREEARKHFRAALSLSPGFLPARLKLGLLRFSGDRRAESTS